MTRHDRQSFLGKDSERRFQNLTVGIVGLGGGGSHVAQQLAHLGIGHFKLFDPDTIEEHNLNRTVGATEADVRAKSPKVKIARRVILSINSRANVDTLEGSWSSDFDGLRSCDVVFGCLDTFAGRDQLESSCRRALIPLIDVGMDVYGEGPYSISGQVATSLPGKPCLRCLGIVREDQLAEEGQRYGSAGGRPQVVWPNGVLASTAVGVLVQLVSPWRAPSPASLLIGYDGDRLVLEQDPRVAALESTPCPHYPANAVGDPHWQGPQPRQHDNRREPP